MVKKQKACYGPPSMVVHGNMTMLNFIFFWIYHKHDILGLL
jgi:hypothetical protein